MIIKYELKSIKELVSVDADSHELAKDFLDGIIRRCTWKPSVFHEVLQSEYPDFMSNIGIINRAEQLRHGPNSFARQDALYLRALIKHYETKYKGLEAHNKTSNLIELVKRVESEIHFD